jgi:hypothetical protein
MPLLLPLVVCVGLWLLFPKSFKFFVGSMVGTFGAMFFWGITLLAWSMAVHSPSWAAMGWSMACFVIVGNVVGCYAAAKG